MTAAELVRSRRSVAAFLDKPIPEGLIEELLESAVWAPNHGFTQPWRFIVLSGEARRDLVSVRKAMARENRKERTPEQIRKEEADLERKFLSIPAILVVVQKQHENPHVREEDYAACCCVTQNFLLLAWERGLGSFWKSFHDDPRIRAMLGLAPDEKVAAFVHLGYPAETPAGRPRASAKARVTRITQEKGAAPQ